MKKGIVLFISLLFIASVSLLILKNLQDTDSYISEQNAKFSKTQIIYFINNAKDEISNILSKQIDREILKDYTNLPFPVEVKDALVILELREYDKYDVNLLKQTDEKKYEHFKNFLQRNGIYDIYTLKDILIHSEKVSNLKQLDDLLENFEKESYNVDVSSIKDYIGFINYDKKEFTLDDDKKEILFYELFVKVNYLKQFAKAYYILNESGGVEYFEFSFK